MKQTALNVLLLLLMSSAVKADIVEYTFTDTNGNQKTTSDQYVNPLNGLKVLLSAGLDRYIKIRVKNKAGGTVYEFVSKKITIDDRLADSKGKEHYGFQFQVPVLVDGDYLIEQEILDLTMNVVTTQSKEIVIDTTPPSVGVLFTNTGGYGMVTTGSEWSLGRGGSANYQIMADGVNDNHGIKKAQLEVLKDGQPYSTIDFSYDATIQRISRSLVYGIFPSTNLDHLFTLTPVITDISGNITRGRPQNVRYDNYYGNVELYGFYNPNSNNSLGPNLDKFDRYTSGMTIYTNPVKGVYRIPKNNWRDYNNAGLTFTNAVGTTSIAHVDNDYVYLVFTAPYGYTNGNQIRFINQHQWAGPGVGYNAVLANSAPKSPDYYVEYEYSDIGWASFYRATIQNDQLPITITKARGVAGVRPYSQVFSHNGQSCTISPGQSQCEIPFNATLSRGTTGYLHASSTMRSADGSLLANIRYAEVNWNDQHYPEVTTEYDSDNKLLTAYIYQPSRGAYFDRLKLRSATVFDFNTNTTVSLSGGKIEEAGSYYTYRWDLTTLPEGEYNLAVVATENHGPSITSESFSYANDTTPPKITFKTANGDNYEEGMLIKGLENILIHIEDVSPYQINSINFTGGPVDDDVQLAWNTQGVNTFGLEYPRVFPSQTEGEVYKILVTVTDSFGQSSTATYSFNYEPNNLFSVETIESLPVSQALYDSEDNPHSYIVSNQLRADDGSLASGDQRLFITVRADSDFGLGFNGINVRAGETKEVYVPLNDNGQLFLPVYPTEDAEGEAQYLIEINNIN
ncbi:Ig-like domain-containing protein [Vibrio owensii]|uniref:Ig-like domain-containing protein n=1 Tax=Vibrio owensii TaxID=696485 RepID=UPI004068D175